MADSLPWAWASRPSASAVRLTAIVRTCSRTLLRSCSTSASSARADEADVEQLRSKVREQVRTMAVKRTAEALGLDAQAQGKLSAIAARYGDQQEALRRDTPNARRALHQLVP